MKGHTWRISVWGLSCFFVLSVGFLGYFLGLVCLRFRFGVIGFEMRLCDRSDQLRFFLIFIWTNLNSG